MDEIRQERDRKISDVHRQMEREKEIYKQKINEYEHKCKDAEQRKN